MLLVACNAGSEERSATTKTTEAAAPAAGEATPAAPAAPIEPGQTMPAFERQATALAPDGSPSTVAISSRKTQRPTAYMFVGTRCNTTGKYLGRIAALEKQYAGKVDFVYLYPNKTDSSDEKQAFHKRHQLRGPMIDDQGGAVAHGLLGGRRTAELVLADKAGVVVYTGAIDDNKEESKVTRRHAAVAIDEHLAGKPVSQPKSVGSA
jgi:hypothetical protein